MMKGENRHACKCINSASHNVHFNKKLVVSGSADFVDANPRFTLIHLCCQYHTHACLFHQSGKFYLILTDTKYLISSSRKVVETTCAVFPVNRKHLNQTHPLTHRRNGTTWPTYLTHHSLVLVPVSWLGIFFSQFESTFLLPSPIRYLVLTNFSMIFVLNFSKTKHFRFLALWKSACFHYENMYCV